MFNQTFASGIAHLNDAQNSGKIAAMILAKGEQAFGFWGLPPNVVTVLSRHLLVGGEGGVMLSMVDVLVGSSGAETPRVSKIRLNRLSVARTAEFSTTRSSVMEQYGLAQDTSFWRGKFLTVALVVLLSNAHAWRSSS